MKKSILIIEDEAGIADTLLYRLERDGFVPRWESTGGGGLSHLLDQEVDLVILDLGLPDMDGLDVLRQVRKTGNLPVLILSARNEDVDRIVGLEVGADDFVSKPFSPGEISARVRAILRRTSLHQEQTNAPVAGGASSLKPGGPMAEHRGPEVAPDFPFRVDGDRKLIYYYNKQLELSRYEYGILELLIRWPGRVYSREQIMDQVWEEPEESFDRVVDSHIKNIRARLKEVSPKEDPIVTRRGIGYGLKEEFSL